MNPTLTTISIKSSPFKVLPNHQQCLVLRQQVIRCRWGTHPKNQELSLKPLRATLGPNATSGANKPNHRATILPSSPVPSVIHELYSSLNDKDSKRLAKLIAPDCVIEDTAYYEPLDAKTIHTFFGRLMEVMGEYVKFSIDEVSGVEPTVAVLWHLEWNGKIIPFTKGCSFYICSGNGSALLIKKVHIFVESPLKPGNIGLEVLRIVTNLFNRFPKLAEGFLKNPEALIQPFLKLYKFFMKAFIPLFLANYASFWAFVARGLTMVLNILYDIFKRFM